MLITKDTQKMDNPCEFGETLRDYCFIPNEYGQDVGCYSTFTLRPEFKKISKKSELGKRLLEYLGWDTEYNDDIKDMAHLYSNNGIHIAWYWDGDGTLVFWEGNKVVYNGDCKKDYVWEWLDET